MNAMNFDLVISQGADSSEAHNLASAPATNPPQTVNKSAWMVDDRPTSTDQVILDAEPQLLITEEIRDHQPGAVGGSGDPPEGPGRDGHKPLMQNRAGHIQEPIPDRDTAPGTFSAGLKDDDYSEAIASGELCKEWRRLQDNGLSASQAARMLIRPAAWFSVNYPRWKREGLAAFMPQRRELGAARKLFTDLPEWFLPVATFYYLTTNLNETRGSMPEAILRTISLPHCPPAVQRRLIKVCVNNGFRPLNGEKLPTCPEKLREDILLRAKQGKPLLPESLTRQITVAAPFVKQFRNPTNAGLDYISASGTQMWIRNGESGEKMFIRGGDVVEADDATINFPVCVPWIIRGCPCSEKFHVKVGRFQWLVAIDVGSRKVLGFNYTARPRASYRGEDVLALMRGVARQHGVPRIWRFERGVWESNLVIKAQENMGSGRISVYSPHMKPFIEGLFNKLWTKLSAWFPEASVGRFRGEGEEASKLLAACVAGQLDPRRYFPMLSDVIAAFEAVIEEHNSSIVRSENWGEWCPHERWHRDASASPLPPLDPRCDWIFSPCVRKWKIDGCNIGGRVRLMEKVSVPFVFSAPFLVKLHGSEARAHFDPFEPRCAATIVLAQPWGNHRAGEVVGVAPQVNETTSYVRMVFGWGDGSDVGLAVRRQNAAAMRREVRGIIGPTPRDQYVESEKRDGLGKVERISTSSGARPECRTDPDTTSQECGNRGTSHNRSLAGHPPSRSAENPDGDIPPAGLGSAEKAHRPPEDDLAAFENDNPHLFI